MDLQQRTRRFGVYVILCACILRFTLAGGPEAVLHRLTGKDPIPTYSETGRNVRFSLSLDHVRESPALWMPEAARPCFLGADAAALEMDYDCILRPDLGSLLEQPLAWNLRDTEPTVLILHTHATESYTRDGEVYEESSPYRTLEEEYNMLSVGDTVGRILEQAGIGVLHDRQLHDYPSYNGAYAHARQSVTALLEAFPGIRLVLDLHRDASETGGEQLRTAAMVDGKPAAQLMFVVGTDVSWSSHASWEENLSLALKLQLLLEQEDPGIMRPLNLRPQRFNQDLSTGALLVEVGAAGNTREEALTAAQKLAEGIIRLSGGTENGQGTDPP